ncbi:MAG TPA: hypothetical protein VH008_35660, partial [Pseudonocardia sp.]|nr:hypothetical protein [Pseudonocardia sp.]
MTATDLLPPPVLQAGGNDRPLAEPGERGTLSIAESVLEKLSAHLLAEVDGVGGAARRVLGVALGADSAEQRARVTATVSGTIALLEVRLSLAYPTPIQATCNRV